MSEALNKVLSRLQDMCEVNGGYRARCPAHDDHNPSLSITLRNGRILLHCFAGCSLESILDKLGLTVRDLSLDSEDGRGERPSAVYDYRDAEGRLVFQVCRFAPKNFRQRRPDGNGGWVWNLREVERVPYRLPELIDAVKRREQVFVVEGEKDCETLAALELKATTNPGGAGKWPKEFAKYFGGARVVILPDNDEAGRKHAQDVAARLHGAAASIKVVDLPDLPPKGDVSDWIQAGHTVDELLQLVEQAENQTSIQSENQTNFPGAGPDGFPYTDLGNAERFVRDHGEDVRFNGDAGKWLIWNGKRWEDDVKGHIYELAKRTIRKLYKYMPNLDKASCDVLLSHIKKSESETRIRAMLTLASKQPGIPVQASELDADQMLLNCLNGTLDLRTGKLRAHAREDLITKLVPVEYNPNADAPRWRRFLGEVFQSNEDLIAFVQRVVGYCLTGSTKEEVLFVLVGKGQNGKTKFVETLLHVLGDYADVAPFASFTTEKKDSASHELAGLIGKRFVSASEGEEGQVFSESVLKQVTGGDTITCRFLYHEYFSYRPAFKLMLSTNVVPHIRSQNRAMKRRIVVIPFRQTFYAPHEGKQPVQDSDLLPKLLAEKSGILAWAVEGCMDWKRGGLAIPQDVLAETDKLFESQDPLGEFLEECCELTLDGEVQTGRLWLRYLSWCEANGRKPAFKDVRGFARALVQRDGIEARKGTGGVRLLTGITLVDDTAIDSTSGVSGIKTPFSEKSLMKGEHETFFRKCPTNATNATFERETDSDDATDDDIPASNQPHKTAPTAETGDSQEPADFDPFAEEYDSIDTAAPPPNPPLRVTVRDETNPTVEWDITYHATGDRLAKADSTSANYDPFAEEPAGPDSLDNPDTSPQVAQSRDGPQDKLESQCEQCGQPVTLTPYEGKNEGWHYYECAHCGDCRTVQAPTETREPSRR